MMIEVTPAAMQKIRDYLSQNNIESGIRVTLMEGGCSGPALGIVLDESGDADRTFPYDGVEFIIHEDMLADCGKVTIDFAEPDPEAGGCSCGGGGRFVVTSENPVAPASGCSCNSSCG